MKRLIQKLLKILTRKILEKQRPQVITVTGSVGKTSAKQAICLVLRGRFSVRGGAKNYNNELGVPLTVLGLQSPQKSLIGWLKLFALGFYLSLFKKSDYPKILVLEIGADKPGDLKYLLEMIPAGLLKAAVLTAVAPAHLEFFGTMEKIFQEKISPFFFLAKDGLAIINQDNCDVQKIKEKIHSAVITFGIKEPALLETNPLTGQTDITINNVRQVERGISFQLNNKGQTLNFFLPEGVYFHQIYPLLAATAVGIFYKMNLRDISQNLAQYTPPAGRLRSIEGQNNSLIIDDTYNSSPESCRRALEALSTMPQAKRKIAILGDMLELGETSEEFHKTIGKMAAQLKVDYLITYGQMAQFIAKSCQANGLPKERIFPFAELGKLSDFLKNFIQTGDVLLVKGSQGMRMEKIVRNIMAQPEKAKDLLVRQGEEWE